MTMTGPCHLSIAILLVTDAPLQLEKRCWNTRWWWARCSHHQEIVIANIPQWHLGTQPPPGHINDMTVMKQMNKCTPHDFLMRLCIILVKKELSDLPDSISFSCCQEKGSINAFQELPIFHEMYPGMTTSWQAGLKHGRAIIGSMRRNIDCLHVFLEFPTYYTLLSHTL